MEWGKRARSFSGHGALLGLGAGRSQHEPWPALQIQEKWTGVGEQWQFTGLMLRHQLSGVLVRHVWARVKKFFLFRMEVV